MLISRGDRPVMAIEGDDVQFDEIFGGRRGRLTLRRDGRHQGQDERRGKRRRPSPAHHAATRTRVPMTRFITATSVCGIGST